MGSLRQLLLVLALLPAAVVVGCGDSGGGDATGGPQGGVEGDVAQAPPPQLQIVRPEPDSSTDEATVSVEGIVTDDAKVEVNGRAAEIEGPANEEGRSRWVAEVPLELGENEIEVVATLDGGETRGSVTITRKKAKKRTADKEEPAAPETDASTPDDPVISDGGQRGPSGAQGGAGGSQGGGAGGSGGGDEDGGQGGPAGGGGNQGGSGGATDGEGGDGGDGGDGDQGGPVGEPPPED